MIVQKIRKSHLIIGFRAKATWNSQFEGYNKLGHHSFFSGHMGYASYIGAYSIVSGTIGRYCSIADNVIFLTYTHPTSKFVSTHPAFYSLKKQSGFTYATEQLFDEEPTLPNSDESIIVGNDVYIGYGATIIGPVIIGDGAVIAANAVVTSNVEPYSIVAGVPARKIKARFSDDEKNFLQKLAWWNKPRDWIKEHSSEFEDINIFMNTVDRDSILRTDD